MATDVQLRSELYVFGSLSLDAAGMNCTIVQLKGEKWSSSFAVLLSTTVRSEEYLGKSLLKFIFRNRN